MKRGGNNNNNNNNNIIIIINSILVYLRANLTAQANYKVPLPRYLLDLRPRNRMLIIYRVA
jgi:hypothetical protein